MAGYRMLQSDVRMDVEEELERLEGVRLSVRMQDLIGLQRGSANCLVDEAAQEDTPAPDLVTGVAE